MADSKKVYAEITFKFTDKTQPKAKVNVKHEDGSELKADGIQSYEKAKELLEELDSNPIYVPVEDSTGDTTP